MLRILSVSLAAYDGIPLEQALDHLAGMGVRWIEPAFIVGYTEPFDQRAFTTAQAAVWRQKLAERGLSCHAMSAHIDLGLPEAVDLFKPRMEFARSLGARIINTNASLATREGQFIRNIEALAHYGEAIGLTIGLENPGNGEENLFNGAEDGIDLLRRLSLPALGLNFDAANLASHRPTIDTTSDTLRALPACIHYHIKDVTRSEAGWRFTPIGEGEIDNPSILSTIATMPDLPVSLELPLRLDRDAAAQPVRAPQPLPLPQIDEAIMRSLTYIRARLTDT